MRYIKNIRLWLAALLLLMLLTGCELLRSDDGAGDITSSVNEPKAATGTPQLVTHSLWSKPRTPAA